MRTVILELEDDAADIMDELIRRRVGSSPSQVVANALRSVYRVNGTRKELEAELLKGLEGEPCEFTEADWEQIDHEVELRASSPAKSSR